MVQRIRLMRISSVFLVILVVAGCGTKGSATGVKQVTVAELGKETDHLVFFNYVGSDNDFHYFTTAEKKRYKVPRAEWANPQPSPLDGGMQLFMTVKDGKLTVPDPKEMAQLSQDEIMHRPYKKK
jgi:hypothetical protein